MVGRRNPLFLLDGLFAGTNLLLVSGSVLCTFFFFGIVRPNPPSGEHNWRNFRFSPGFSRFEDPMGSIFWTFACNQNDCLKTN